MSDLAKGLLQAASFIPNHLVFPNSWVGHLPIASWLMRQLNPSVFVELGTHSGNSYMSFCQTVEEAGLHTRCYAVDTWEGDPHAGNYDDGVHRSLAVAHAPYARFSTLLRMTFDDALEHVADGSVELLHIDGFHSYEAVRHDYESWERKLAPHAVVLFHDTAVREREFGVWKFWAEITARYPRHLEFTHSNGLGILQRQTGAGAFALEWLEPNSPWRGPILDYFRGLSDHTLQRYGLTEVGGAQAKQNLIELQQNLAEAEQAAQGSQHALQQAQMHLHHVLHSHSWRITAPLRLLSQQVRGGSLLPMMHRGMRVARGVRQAVQRYGVLALTKKTVSHVRRHGLRATLHQARQSLRAAPAIGGSYAQWIAHYDTLHDDDRADMRLAIERMESPPHISVLMPTYNANPDWLRAAIDSVRAQIYPHWELCIADDASTDSAIAPLLAEYQAREPRIKLMMRTQNGHISAASNSALELATGNFVALMDHDDMLPEHALYWIAEAIAAQPQAKLIYSDEDKIDVRGVRSAPYFKSDYNYDLLLSHNMICHLGVYETALVREVGGFREGLQGAQDWDLALRCIEQLSPDQITHIPRILYHWRMHAESTAHSGEKAKPYAYVAAARALNEHLARVGKPGVAEILPSGVFRVRYPLPEKAPLVSILIPTRDGVDLLRTCISSILTKTTYTPYEIVIIDNGSTQPETLDYFAKLASDVRVRVVCDAQPFNYSALNNLAAKQARGDVLALLNNDIEVISGDWLQEMVSLAVQPEIGAVGARLWYPNDTLQHGGIILGLGGYAGHSHRHFPKDHPGHAGRARLLQSFSAVTGACLIVSKDKFEQVGGLDAEELPIAFNDVDFCLKLKAAGYRNVWTPYAELYHHESASRGYEDTPEKQARMHREGAVLRTRWPQWLANDPAYNPNLTTAAEDFNLAWPPRVALGRSARPVAGRVDKALRHVQKLGLGLEIGPSHNPLAPKRDGYNVHILDHANREELIAKYTGHGVNLEAIEEVDLVWKGEALDELIGRRDHYDWVIASHVIEHTPDLISFLNQLANVLRPRGIISLVIPDKRYCFDYFRPVSSTGDVLQAYLEQRRLHTPGAVFDQFASAATLSGKIAWYAHEQGPIALVHPQSEILSHYEKAQQSREYIDVHQWRFTPSSFLLMLRELQEMGLIQLAVKDTFDTEGCEFFVTLVKGEDGMALPDRLELMRRAQREIHAMAIY